MKGRSSCVFEWVSHTAEQVKEEHNKFQEFRYYNEMNNSVKSCTKFWWVGSSTRPHIIEYRVWGPSSQFKKPNLLSSISFDIFSSPEIQTMMGIREFL